MTGGSSFWIEGPPWLDSRRLAGGSRRAERMLIEPGDVHFAQDEPPLNYFRLGFASIGPDRDLRRGASGWARSWSGSARRR